MQKVCKPIAIALIENVMNGFIVVLFAYKGINRCLHLQVFKFAKIRKTEDLTIVNFAKIRKIGLTCLVLADKLVSDLSNALRYRVFSFLRK